MFFVQLRALSPFIGIGLTVLIVNTAGWPWFIGLLLVIPVMWITNLALTWLAIAGLRATSAPPDWVTPESVGLAPDGSWLPESTSGSAPAPSSIAESSGPYGPESDWIEALVRVPGEFSPHTWGRIADELPLFVGAGPTPRRELQSAVRRRGGSPDNFLAQSARARTAVMRAFERDVPGLRADALQRCLAVVFDISDHILAKRSISTETLLSAVAPLQHAIDSLAEGPGRSVVGMLEQEASFRAMLVKTPLGKAPNMFDD